MDSDEKKIGGGSGGGGGPCPVTPPPPCPDPKPKPSVPKKNQNHDDIRTIDGMFIRNAGRIALMSRGNKKKSGGVIIMAGGHQPAEARIVSNDQIQIHTGKWDWQGDSATPYHGVIIHTDPDNERDINIVRGNMDDPDNAQWISLDPSGNINISVGASGSINLNVGGDGTDEGAPISSISISSTGITIKGPLVQIN